MKTDNNYTTIFYLIYRRLLVFTRDKVDVIITFGQTPLMALAFFLVFQKIVIQGSTPELFQYIRTYNAPDVIVFLAVLSSVWFGFSKAIIEIPKQMIFYKQESLSFLSDTQFIISHYVALSIICLFQVIIFSVSFNTLFVFIPNVIAKEFSIQMFLSIFFKSTLLFWLISLTSISTAMFISFYTKSISAANAIFPFIIILQILFGGSLIQPLTKMNDSIYNISNVMVSRWGYEATCLLYEDMLPKQSKDKNIISDKLKYVGTDQYEVYYENLRLLQKETNEIIKRVLQESLQDAVDTYYSVSNDQDEQAFISKLQKTNFQLDKINLPDNFEQFQFYTHTVSIIKNEMEDLVLNNYSYKPASIMTPKELQLWEWMIMKYPKVKLFRDINFNYCILMLFIHIAIFFTLLRINYFIKRNR